MKTRSVTTRTGSGWTAPTTCIRSPTTRRSPRRGARIVTRADGVYIYTSEGDKILDGMSGLWCVALGYGRRELAEAAYRQMLELPYYNSFFQSSTTPAIELARILTEVTPPQFNHVFYTGSGSEANDTADPPGAPLLAAARQT